MLGNAIEPEIRELIESKQFADLKATLGDFEPADLAELVADLDGYELGVVFRLLPKERAAALFAELPLDQQEHLLEALSGEALAAILNEMPPDDRTELLEELPEDISARLIGSLNRQERQVAIGLLRYPEDSIGRLMTPEFVAINAGWTVTKVFEYLRQVAPQKETLSVLYVVDEAGKLVDDLHLEDLVLAEPAGQVADLIDRQPVCLSAWDDREQAVAVFMKYDAVALPVVEKDGRLVGIVTIDDVMDVAEEETTEDFHKLAGVAALEEPYFAVKGREMIWKRLPWLALLFAAELLTVLALTRFEQTLPTAIFALIVLFMPLINATAGNTGSQMSGLIIRSLAVHEIAPRDWLKVLLRELRLGLAMGVVLGAMGVAAAVTLLALRPDEADAFEPLQRSLIERGMEAAWPVVAEHLPGQAQQALARRQWSNALGVGSSVLVAVVVANLFGAMIPLVFKALRLDPAVTSAPFLASIMDVTGVMIYFSIASGILSLLS